MLLKRTTYLAMLLVFVAGALAFGLTRVGQVAGQDDKQAMIDNAMLAGPASISAEATIVDYEMDATGKFVVLREGTNGWTCFPDTIGTPSDDPMCVDQVWMDWMYALMNGTAPNSTVAGLSYMTDASNTDPAATEPAPGEDWVVTPPHVMILLPGELDQTAFSTDPYSGGPFIMWAGTPYEHIMMPVADGEPVE
jgi:hypothetical protein